MDISSVSTSSLPMPNSQSGTKVASKNESVSSLSNGKPPVAQSAQKEIQKLEAVQAAQQQEAKRDRELEQLAEKLSEFVSTFNKGLSFRVDEQSGRNVVTVFEMSTGDVIRQIPDEEMLELVRQLAAHSSGLVAEKV